MRFDQKSKQKQAKGKEEKQKGIMGLKFMERAQKKEQEALKADVNLAVKQIRGEDDYSGGSDSASDSEEDEQRKPALKNTAKEFGVEALKTKSGTADAR